ncbi:MAG: isocitrate lyase/phosphoenolpyruvate mutase family protein [Gammaproteobacteria bacterium]|nr:isocitrate lyase/phosphoenolpyruvate mutase family protein [Gammaproteobacteria bacterium]
MDPNIDLVGRCEILLTDQQAIDVAVARLSAYATAGADCLYAPGASDPAHIAAIVEAVAPKPVNVLLWGETMHPRQLAALGVRRMSVGGKLAKAAWQAFDAGCRGPDRTLGPSKQLGEPAEPAAGPPSPFSQASAQAFRTRPRPSARVPTPASRHDGGRHGAASRPRSAAAVPRHAMPHAPPHPDRPSGTPARHRPPASPPRAAALRSPRRSRALPRPRPTPPRRPLRPTRPSPPSAAPA